MALSSLGTSLESSMAGKNQAKSCGGGGAQNPQVGSLQSMIKAQLDFADEDEMQEPDSVLNLTQCISPPIPPGLWALQQQQEQQALAEFERQQAQLLQQKIFQQQQQQLYQQQQMFQWQQTQLWEHQLWEQQQAEIAELQYLQNQSNNNNAYVTGTTGFEGVYTVDPHHGAWDPVNYADPYGQLSTSCCGVDDTMMTGQQGLLLHSDPWVDFQQQENAFGSQLMQGLPCLEDPLILESWMTSCSGNSSLTSISTEADSSSSQGFMIPDEHESLLSNTSTKQQHQQQQQQQQISRSPSVCSEVEPVSKLDLVDTPLSPPLPYDMLPLDNNFNSTASPMCVDAQPSVDDIKPASNWFLSEIQDTIGPPPQQGAPPSPSSMCSSTTYVQDHPSSISRNSSPVATHSDHHDSMNGNTSTFMSAQPASSTTEIRPSSGMFGTITPSPVISCSESLDARTETAAKPSGKLWGPQRPASHLRGGGDSVYVTSVSDPGLSRRRSQDAAQLANQRGANSGNVLNAAGQKTGNNGGAGRVVTLAELASGGVKMGGVQLPTVGTQIPSVVRLAVETQASGMGGVRMVQVLLACAEAVACRDSRQANILLQQLQHMASPYGDAMQRITACFVEGLSARLASNGSQPFKFTNPPRKSPSVAEKREGFNLVYQSSPYVAFGHFAANSAILEAFEGEERVHVVDLGMTHSLQWPYLIHGLAKRPSGPPKLLRITGFGLSLESMEEAGEELARVAAEAKVPFEFRAVMGPLEELKRPQLELREGEALAVNSVLQLHCVVKESRGSLNAVLQSIHELSPKILTLVEQDASHNGPFFLGRFMEALHYYSAIFDSLDAILPRNSEQRVKMEQFHFAEEIKNIVSCEGPARVERHERVDQWRRRMSRAGFQTLPLKFLSQARLWLGLYSCEGYTLSEEKGCLVLGWKGKPIVAASSWKR